MTYTKAIEIAKNANNEGLATLIEARDRLYAEIRTNHTAFADLTHHMQCLSLEERIAQLKEVTT